MGKQFLSHAEDASGYPNYAFEAWYQQGMACHMARLPKHLRKQAYRHLVHKWRSKGATVSMWQVRAFVDGAMGMDDNGQRTSFVPAGYCWPTPPDRSWQLVVCVYPDGEWDLDFVHPVSRRFWSEDNDFLELPEDRSGILNRRWFENMGFDVMHMNPTMVAYEGKPTSHMQVLK